MNALVRDLYSGGSGLRGTTAEGTVRLAEADINNMLASVGTGTSSTGVRVEIQHDNRVLARFGVLHATVVLPRRSDPSQSPALTFALSSIAVAWTLKQVLKQPYVRIHGREVTVDLDALPALGPYRELLRYVRRLEMTTAAGVLTVGFQIAI